RGWLGEGRRRGRRSGVVGKVQGRRIDERHPFAGGGLGGLVGGRLVVPRRGLDRRSGKLVVDDAAVDLVGGIPRRGADRLDQGRRLQDGRRRRDGGTDGRESRLADDGLGECRGRDIRRYGLGDPFDADHLAGEREIVLGAVGVRGVVEDRLSVAGRL